MKSIPFSKLREGMSARVVRMLECPCEWQRLAEMGLTEGAEFRVVKVAPLGDPIEIEIRGYRLCLRKKETSCLEVEPLG